MIEAENTATNILDSQEFYELMQGYRWASRDPVLDEQEVVYQAFEAVKGFLRSHFEVKLASVEPAEAVDDLGSAFQNLGEGLQNPSLTIGELSRLAGRCQMKLNLRLVTTGDEPVGVECFVHDDGYWVMAGTEKPGSTKGIYLWVEARLVEGSDVMLHRLRSHQPACSLAEVIECIQDWSEGIAAVEKFVNDVRGRHPSIVGTIGD